MKVQDIIERLTVLGLDENEATVYVHLSMMGPSKAGDIAASLKLHRTEAYRTLQTLVERGFATATLGRPAKYEAAAPEKLFTDILEAQRARAASIERARSEIGEALVTLRSTATDTLSRNTFRVLQGRREIFGIAERMIREAKTDVRYLSTHPGAVSMGETSGLTSVLAARAAEGVAARLALRVPPAQRDRAAELAALPGVAARHVDADRTVQFVVADERELLVWVVSDPSMRLASEEDVAIWSDAADFVGAHALFFDTLWAHGKDVAPVAKAGDA